MQIARRSIDKIDRNSRITQAVTARRGLPTSEGLVRCPESDRRGIGIQYVVIDGGPTGRRRRGAADVVGDRIVLASTAGARIDKYVVANVDNRIFVGRREIAAVETGTRCRT